MSENCDVIVILPIYGQFGAMWKPYSGHIACKTYVFININVLSYKTDNRTKKSLTQLLHYCFKKGTINADISKIKRALVLTDMFS